MSCNYTVASELFRCEQSEEEHDEGNSRFSPYCEERLKVFDLTLFCIMGEQ